MTHKLLHLCRHDMNIRAKEYVLNQSLTLPLVIKFELYTTFSLEKKKPQHTNIVMLVLKLLWDDKQQTDTAPWSLITRINEQEQTQMMLIENSFLHGYISRIKR